jgi:hypothetical protein
MMIHNDEVKMNMQERYWGDALSGSGTLSNEAEELDEKMRELAVSQSLVHYSPSQHETDGAKISAPTNEQRSTSRLSIMV